MEKEINKDNVKEVILKIVFNDDPKNIRLLKQAIAIILEMDQYPDEIPWDQILWVAIGLGINPKEIPTTLNKLSIDNLINIRYGISTILIPEGTKEFAAESLLVRLGIDSYTQRHLGIINDFLASGGIDCEKLLEDLGNWEEKDLEIAEKWLEEYRA